MVICAIPDTITPRTDPGLFPGNEDLETFIPKPASKPSMKVPSDPFSNDDAQLTPVEGERRLLLAVFSAAFVDLISSCTSKRNDAIRWFEGRLPNELISYAFFRQHFDLKPSRLKLLHECIKDRHAIYKITGWKKFRNVGHRRK